MLVQHAESVTIVALDGEDIVVVRQERAGAKDVTVELPSGKLEPDEPAEDAVRRELVEECGLDASEWRRVGAFWAVPAYSTEYVNVYEAIGLARAAEPLDPDDDEQIEVDRIAVADALETLSDAVSLAAFALWQARR